MSNVHNTIPLPTCQKDSPYHQKFIDSKTGELVCWDCCKATICKNCCILTPVENGVLDKHTNGRLVFWCNTCSS